MTFADHETFNGHEDAVKIQWPKGYAEKFLIHSRAIIIIVMEIVKNHLEYYFAEKEASTTSVVDWINCRTS